jgi:hypothetical protein
MSNLMYQLQGLMLRNKDGSHSTQSTRRDILLMISNQLKDGGYKLACVDSLKPKHVDFLLQRWQSEGLSAGTIKNRMAQIRWWAEKVGKSSMLPKSNSGANHAINLDIEKRCYVPTESRAKTLDLEKLEQVKDPYVKLSLQLQQEFGLRREESIKFNLGYAIRGDRLIMKSSWTKGGRPREIPIRNSVQFELLKRVQEFVGNGSLIRKDRNYVQQLKVYEREVSLAGLDKNHGLRHMYAQLRYQELTGWPAPLAGGPVSKQLTSEQKQVDRYARLVISSDLGHSREQITVTYLGR